MTSENKMKRKQVLSAIQPTGNLHLGRYFGAIKNWVELQEKYDCIYGIVNYHAITMPFDPKKLKDQVWDLAYDLIAVGLKPENIFIQSMIPEHTELAWIFNCVSSFGEVSRMTQFKDKSQQINEKDKDAFISTGLFTYPVLQAADILIYKADYVPVGKDQEQHLELSRNIAQRFNQIVGKEYFVLPETLYTEIPKVMSTADPTKKMSASLGPKHYVNIFSDPDVIRKQIKTAVTATEYVKLGDIKTISNGKVWEIPIIAANPGLENLFRIFIAAGGEGNFYDWVNNEEGDELKSGRLKEVIADIIISMTQPFREKRLEIVNDSKAYKEKIMDSSALVRKQAQQTIREVKDLIGLMNVHSY